MKEVIEEVIETKYERLQRLLVDELKEAIELRCSIHGDLKLSIGKFLKSQTVCTACKKDLPIWHEDMLVYPVTKALTELAREKKLKQITEEVSDEDN